MTEPLYQHDAYLASFDAEVEGREPDGVVLDRSAFFPGGGGQPVDVGVLEHGGAELPVLGVERRDGRTVLLLDGAPPPVGATLVTGGNMEPLKARMDFELAAMSADFAEAVEAALRAEVAADRPVHVSFLSPREFAARPELIRTKTNLLPPGLEIVRVIDIEGLDRQADGGTHVARTGEVGAVHVVGHQSKGTGNKRLRIALDPAPTPAPRG